MLFILASNLEVDEETSSFAEQEKLREYFFIITIIFCICLLFQEINNLVYSITQSEIQEEKNEYNKRSKIEFSEEEMQDMKERNFYLGLKKKIIEEKISRITDQEMKNFKFFLQYIHSYCRKYFEDQKEQHKKKKEMINQLNEKHEQFNDEHKKIFRALMTFIAKNVSGKTLHTDKYELSPIIDKKIKSIVQTYELVKQAPQTINPESVENAFVNLENYLNTYKVSIFSTINTQNNNAQLSTGLSITVLPEYLETIKNALKYNKDIFKSKTNTKNKKKYEQDYCITDCENTKYFPQIPYEPIDFDETISCEDAKSFYDFIK